MFRNYLHIINLKKTLALLLMGFMIYSSLLTHWHYHPPDEEVSAHSCSSCCGHDDDIDDGILSYKIPNDEEYDAIECNICKFLKNFRNDLLLTEAKLFSPNSDFVINLFLVDSFIYYSFFATSPRAPPLFIST